MRLYRLIENFLTYAQTELLIYDAAKRDALQHGYLVYPTMVIERDARAKAQSAERLDDLTFSLEQVEVIGISEEYLKKIVEEHLGEIAFLDRAGGGTRVRIAFDADRLAGMATEEPALPRQSGDDDEYDEEVPH